jgi:hypothetical protein
VRGDLGERAREVRFVEPERREQELLRRGEALDGRFAGDH